jgi:site-specific DNA-methyltransferase (adenine-specific)
MQKIKSNKIYCGDSLELFKQLPDESIDCIVTSPPYWALRDYGNKNQIGLEADFNDYIKKLCDIFDEAKRVLKNAGTCWVNLGDTYYTKSGGSFLNDALTPKNKIEQLGLNRANSIRGKGLIENKNLALIPFRFALEMQKRGWIIRNVIIWHKPNCMPSSVRDRFTVNFEYLFFFVKNKRYYFEQQREPHKKESIERTKHDWNGHREYGSSFSGMDVKKMCHPDGRNKRCIWEITTRSFKGAHFAVFPPELIETPIKAGCPEFICSKCGKPKIKILKKIGEAKIPAIGGIKHRDNGNPTYSGREKKNIYDEGKYKASCDCNAEFSAGIVLDPFIGSGTTAVVCKRLGRNYLGFDLNKKYCEMARRRVNAEEGK